MSLVLLPLAWDLAAAKVIAGKDGFVLHKERGTLIHMTNFLLNQYQRIIQRSMCLAQSGEVFLKKGRETEEKVTQRTLCVFRVGLWSSQSFSGSHS